ncbi:MAG: hypothetical protein FJW23_07840 [Acidimicrobiia bacterium]|nr:hypothetical protein [Acidimicrobiia bacterium]
MDDCRSIGGLITPYVDGELDQAGRAAVERHAEVCPPCRGHLVREGAARTAVRRSAAGLEDVLLPPGLETRCRAVLAAAAGPAPVPAWRRWWIPAGAGVGALATALLVLVVLTDRTTAALAAQLTADHVKCFAVFQPDAVAADDVAAAEERLASYGWTTRVPGSVPEEHLRLLGARQCLYAKGKIAHVMYDVDGEAVSLFRLEGVQVSDATVSSLGYRCRIWAGDGCTFVLVGPEDGGARLTRVAEYVKRTAR